MQVASLRKSVFSQSGISKPLLTAKLAVETETRF